MKTEGANMQQDSSSSSSVFTFCLSYKMTCVKQEGLSRKAFPKIRRIHFFSCSLDLDLHLSVLL